jgi:hypothetical protein
MGAGNSSSVVAQRVPGLLLLWMLYAAVFFPSIIYANSPANATIPILDEKGLSGWEEERFKGKTSYKIVELGGDQVSEAVSRASASGIYKRQAVNIKDYPYLNWRWRIENKLDTGNEMEKSGDDYVARVYLLIDGGLRFWNSRAMSYVWANQSEAGSIWDNAYAGDSVIMFALKSAKDPTGTWLHEKRNVYEDLKTVFGEEIATVDAVAVMTDTDDSNSTALTYYADIFFSAE